MAARQVVLRMVVCRMIKLHKDGTIQLQDMNQMRKPISFSSSVRLLIQGVVGPGITYFLPQSLHLVPSIFATFQSWGILRTKFSSVRQFTHLVVVREISKGTAYKL